MGIKFLQDWTDDYGVTFYKDKFYDIIDRVAQKLIDDGICIGAEDERKSRLRFIENIDEEE